MATFWRIVERVAAFDWHVVLHFDAKDLTSIARDTAKAEPPGAAERDDSDD